MTNIFCWLGWHNYIWDIGLYQDKCYCDWCGKVKQRIEITDKMVADYVEMRNKELGR